ncbi:MAG: helix-turn-helix transcriptional regulator [Bacteroidia bacterium]|nr:helix-turn-helix transcriptional regulator [Bacteroidia bacterium]
MYNLHASVSLMDTFPDFSARGFNMDVYNNFFKTSNSIINARASNIAYPEHWGGFSIKCAFGGEEFYQVQNRKYAVNDNNFLIFNEGQHYSSYIFSNSIVESFTLNFTSGFVQEVNSNCLHSDEQLLDNPFDAGKVNTEFVEKLYQHNNTVSPILFKIRELTRNFNANKGAITELYYQLMEKLLLLHKEVAREIDFIKACKPSTRKELYRRLHYAKDYIDSCYASEITLQELSLISLMNAAYFLRQFKKYFRITPYQYLMRRRIQAAAEMMPDTRLTISDICTAVGYQDASSFTKLFKKLYGLSPEKYRYEIS